MMVLDGVTEGPYSCAQVHEGGSELLDYCGTKPKGMQNILGRQRLHHALDI